MSALMYMGENASGGPAFLSSLKDVGITSIEDKQILLYDSTTRTWKNHSITASDIAYGSTDVGSAISALNSSKQDVIKYKTESLTFTNGHREVRLSDLGITVNHLINVYSYSTGYDITFNYEASGTVNMVCRTDTTFSGNINVIIVYV